VLTNVAEFSYNKNEYMEALARERERERERWVQREGNRENKGAA
jgi:hypothetical protein